MRNDNKKMFRSIDSKKDTQSESPYKPNYPVRSALKMFTSSSQALNAPCVGAYQSEICDNIPSIYATKVNIKQNKTLMRNDAKFNNTNF